MSDPHPESSWIMELRARLASSGERLPESDVGRAAVLVPLYVDSGELWTFLTRRTDDLPIHQGQIAFPGGPLESGEEAWDAALREAHEEVGLHPRLVLKLGELPEIETLSSFRIVPCVGAVPYPVETEPSSDEVDEVFAVPITAFANPTAIEERVVTVDDEQHLLRIYHVGNRHVWGPTAQILQDLLERLGLAVAVEPN